VKSEQIVHEDKENRLRNFIRALKPI
jgi:hypothetical protein